MGNAHIASLKAEVLCPLSFLAMEETKELDKQGDSDNAVEREG